MKAARLYGKEKLKVEDVPLSQIGPDEILIRVKAALICGTDVRMYKNGKEGITSENPLIIGHEVSGIIEETGPNITFYKRGMRVAVAPNYGCGVCDLCVRGNHQLCTRSEAIGVTTDGGFAEFMVVPSQAVQQGCVSVLSDEVSYQEAALVEPLSCVYNSFERTTPHPGNTVLIIGAGPIGLMHAKMYRASGAGMVLINDFNNDRLKACKTIEPELITIAGKEVEDAVKEYTKGKGVDICITACPASEAQQTALRVTAINGKVMFFGGLPKDRENVELNTNLIHYRQLYVSGTTRQSLGQFRDVLSLIEKKRISLEGLVTNTYPLEKLPAALETSMKGEGLKHAIVMEDEL